MLKSGAQRLSSSLPRDDGTSKRVCVYDCRLENQEVNGEFFETTGLNFKDFIQRLQQRFKIGKHETFVLTTTDRTVLDFAKFEKLENGSTLHLLQNKDRVLSLATKEHIDFTPHYDTLIRSGTYEYFTIEGHNSVSYAIAELIDNALSATVKNTGVRTVEIQMLFDETLGKPAVIILDNGCGMTSKQLNNWAVYRLSKFSRDNDPTLPSHSPSYQGGYVRPDPVPRSLNSDISYFGVGGKHAVFFIGDSARMITKPAGSPDVHELVLSKEDFERKMKNKEDVYSGIIRNRKPCDSTHVQKDERFLHALIAEECRKKSFTAVVITGVQPEHITFLKQDFEVWTRQLAHIYHYYIHGVSGNDLKSSSTDSDFSKIYIQITLREKNRVPRVINLREVDNDMETLYINSAADVFEFKAFTQQNGGTVEGVIRYHPFLFNRETYPKDPNAVQASPDNDDDDNESGVVHQARGKKAIFNCFWNGRLIPYTSLSDFDWCTRSKDSRVPAECYNRLSGVLFTDDKFEVSTNKLHFMELELKLRDKSAIFTRIVNGQKQRGNIQREFTQWLQQCHEKLDKQIKFVGYKETLTRTDVPTKKYQYPWGAFSAIEWDGKVYRAGQLVKSHRTQPILYGTVIQFLLYGQYKGDVFATGGQVEIALEPRGLHDKTKTIFISKIDQTATDEAIKSHIEDDFAKLPDKLKVDWPQRNPLPQNAVRPAGTVIGPLKVEILNMKQESLSRMPVVGQGPGKKLAIKLQVFQQGAEESEVLSFIAQHSTKWGFWFKKIENLTRLGKYTLSLSTLLSESNATDFGGRTLPSYKLNFTIKEGKAESFVPDAVSSTVRVGEPFSIPLLILDAYDHPATPPADLKPSVQCSGLRLCYEKVECSGTTFTITGVKASGKVLKYQQSKPYELKVTLPGLKKDTQSINIVLLPGKPHSLHVCPEENPIMVENRDCAKFNVEVHDEGGNITTNPRQIVRCQVEGLPMESTDCSSTGAGELKTKPLNVKIIKGEPQKLKVQFEMPSQKTVAAVVRELMVMPSKRVCLMEVYSQDDDNLVLRNNEKIEWLAGGLLENLFYRLFDEAGREVPLADETASKIKVNWTGDVNVKDLVKGKLPDVQVPTQVQEERFYQVSYQDQSVSVSFTIVPRHDEPRRLKATVPQSAVRLGEVLPGKISLELLDQYDNATKTLTPDCVNLINVEAEGLDRSAIVFTWQGRTSSVLVSGIQFQSGPLGSREVCFTYKSYVERVLIKVTAGVPTQLKLISEPDKPLQVLNDRGIATPFVIQLCDKWGNPSPDQRVVVELKFSPLTLKVKAAVTSQPVNAEGKASFTVNSVTGPKGFYHLEFCGCFNSKPIPGPSVNLIIIPDPNKPVDLLVDYNTKAKFPAGGKFPVFFVTVISDDGSPMTNFNPADASMLLWQGVSAALKPPQTATELKCSQPMGNERNDHIHFRDKDIPELVGNYTIQFSLLVDKTNKLFSNQIIINVVANQPVKLAPDAQPPPPVVSFGTVMANRTLVDDMTLRIVDSYGNPAGQDLNGKVTVSMKNASRNKRNLPLFEGRASSTQFSLVEGKVHITTLAIMENSPGEDGSSYILLFTPEMSVGSSLLAPFELPFHFYNDVENQRKMSALAKKKNDLVKDVKAYTDIFNTYSELLELLKSHYEDASRKETEQRNLLNMKNVTIANSVSIPDIEQLLRQKTAEADSIQQMQRRVFSIHDHFSGQPDVLGMVGHLALVQEDDAARVISWHISGDMDCVVTKTTAAARRIYNHTHGKQQVMPLDGINVVFGDRPLPHVRNGRMLFNPSGNPVYAREVLIYPQNQESCKTVFKNLLGDTILIDDLDSATNYRLALVQNKMVCPTILTRQGDRISSRGKFGGAQNRAPPMNRLQVFGAPCPPHLDTLREQINLLNQYHSTLQKRDKAAKDHDDHKKKMDSQEMLTKHQEMMEKQRQLEEIEEQTASTTRLRPIKRVPEDAGEPSGIIAKRPRDRPT